MPLIPQIETALYIAWKYEIDLEGCEVFYEPDLPEGYYGMSGIDNIHLGKSAFVNEEQLGRVVYEVNSSSHLSTNANICVNAVVVFLLMPLMQ